MKERGNTYVRCNQSTGSHFEGVRVQRLMRRDGISEAYARARIRAQHGEDWFRARCDHTLRNDENLDAFRVKCLAFLDTLGIMKENCTKEYE